MGVEEVDRRVLLEPDEAEEHRQQEHRAGDQLRADRRQRERAASRGTGSARARSRPTLANAVATAPAAVQMISAVDQVALEVDACPHLAERRERRVQQVVAPVASWPSVCSEDSDEPDDRREHDREHDPGQRVERDWSTAAPAGVSRGRAAVVVMSVAPGRGGSAVPDGTHTSIASISSVEAAAPKPNRLLENDWRYDQGHHQVGVRPRVGAEHHVRDRELVGRVDDAEQQLDGDQRPHAAAA